CTPVRYADQGSYGEGQNASAVGRTWAITAFRPISWARSSQARYSSCCAWAVSPEREGQSMVSTEESHIPRNCRAGEAGAAEAGADGSAGAGTPAAVAATAAVPTAAPVLRRKKERRSTGRTALWAPRSVTRITHPRMAVRGGQAAPGPGAQLSGSLAPASAAGASSAAPCSSSPWWPKGRTWTIAATMPPTTSPSTKEKKVLSSQASTPPTAATPATAASRWCTNP